MKTLSANIRFEFRGKPFELRYLCPGATHPAQNPVLIIRDIREDRETRIQPPQTIGDMRTDSILEAFSGYQYRTLMEFLGDDPE